MTDLTDKWKKGQLKGFRWYYVKFKTGEIDSCWLTEWSDELGAGGQYFDGIKEENIVEVLAPVPSYEELQNINKSVNDLMASNIKLVEENTKLKELLKECRECVDENQEFSKSIGRNRIQPRNKGLLKRIDEVLK